MSGTSTTATFGHPSLAVFGPEKRVPRHTSPVPRPLERSTVVFWTLLHVTCLRRRPTRKNADLKGVGRTRVCRDCRYQDGREEHHRVKSLTDITGGLMLREGYRREGQQRGTRKRRRLVCNLPKQSAVVNTAKTDAPVCAICNGGQGNLRTAQPPLGLTPAGRKND